MTDEGAVYLPHTSRDKMTATIIQGTTPNIVFNLSDAEITTSSISHIEMTVSDCQRVHIKKTEGTYSETYKVTFTLTESETLALPSGDYRIQLRIQLNDESSTIHSTKMIPLKVLPLASRSPICPPTE